MNKITQNPKLIQFAALLVVFFALCVVIESSTNSVLWRIPEISFPFSIDGKDFSFWGLPGLINDALDFLIFEWLPIETYDSENRLL